MRNEVLIIAAVGLAGCATHRAGVPAKGQVDGVSIETTVDSALARYYVEVYLAGGRSAPEWDALIEQKESRLANGPLSREDYREIAQNTSPDFATLLFIREQLQSADQRAFQATFSRNLQLASFEPRRLRVLFAPGFLYRAHPETGADFARQRKWLSAAGIETVLIETDQTGSVEANARLIAEALLENGSFEGDLVVVSASKSGGEVAYALGSVLAPGQTPSNLRAWLNIGGVLKGSPLADAATTGLNAIAVHLYVWLSGWSMDGVCEMTTAIARPRFDSLRFPSHVRIVNYVPVPLSGDLTEMGRDGYEDLKSEGPNDGLVLLADEIVPGVETILDVGRDHYLEGLDVERHTMALLATVLDSEPGRISPAGSASGVQVFGQRH